MSVYAIQKLNEALKLQNEASRNLNESTQKILQAVSNITDGNLRTQIRQLITESTLAQAKLGQVAAIMEDVRKRV